MPLDKPKQYKRISEWKRQNIDRIALEVSKGLKEEWREKAKAEGKSLNEWIIEKVSRD